MNKDELLFAGPYSETGRRNLTILASDDNGVSFPRSLLITPGGAGYTGLQVRGYTQHRVPHLNCLLFLTCSLHEILD